MRSKVVRKSPNIYCRYTAVHSIHESCSSVKSIEKKRDYEGEYCIIRPSMIYGSQDKNMHKVIDFIKKYKFFPFRRWSETYAACILQDLAEAIGLSLEANHPQTYQLHSRSRTSNTISIKKRYSSHYG